MVGDRRCAIMKISKIEVSVVNVPFVAPIRWSGGANADWTRLVIQMHTDDGLIGLGETLGGEVTKALIETEIAAMFLGEDPFDLERILSKATFVPLYYGKCGHCAIAGLELACWDLMGKARRQKPVCQLLGGRLHDEIPFAGYLYYRNPDRHGRGRIDTADQVIGHASDMVRRNGFSTLKYKGGVKTPEEEIETLFALRKAFPEAKLALRSPGELYSPATSIRILGKRIEALDLEYYEDPCWGRTMAWRGCASGCSEYPDGDQHVRDRSRRRCGRVTRLKSARYQSWAISSNRAASAS